MKIVLSKIWKNNDAQATVELAVMFPVIIIIAAICINALTFFSECSSFDRDFKQAVVSFATSPAYGQDRNSIEALILDKLNETYKNNFLDVSIKSQNINGGFVEYCASLNMHPTLFGLGLKSEIFCCKLPVLTHTQKINVEQYKPGVII